MTIFYEKLKIPVLLNKSFNYIRPMNNSCDSKGRLSQQANRHSDRLLEVVSKPQIRFKGPAKRDYISDLKKLMYASSAGRSRKRSIHGYVSIYRRLCCTLTYKIRCESRLRGNAAIGPQMGF